MTDSVNCSALAESMRVAAWVIGESVGVMEVFCNNRDKITEESLLGRIARARKLGGGGQRGGRLDLAGGVRTAQCDIRACKSSVIRARIRQQR